MHDYLIKNEDDVCITLEGGVIFKHARNKSKSDLIENQYRLLRCARGRIPYSFELPEIYSFEKENGFNKLGLNHINGTKLGTKEKLDDKFEEYVKQIALNLINMQKFKAEKLKNDFSLSNRGYLNAFSIIAPKQIVKLKAKAYSKDVKYDCSKLFERIDKSDISKVCFNHCEVMPWHIIERKNKLYLLDGEWSSNYVPKHYDVVHLATRLFVIYGKDTMTKNLLGEYWFALPNEEKAYFEKTLNGLAALRAIGEMRDATLKIRELKKENLPEKDKSLMKKIDLAYQNLDRAKKFSKYVELGL